MLARRGKLKMVKFRDSYWRSIDSHRDLEEASKDNSVLSKYIVRFFEINSENQTLSSAIIVLDPDNILFIKVVSRYL